MKLLFLLSLVCRKIYSKKLHNREKMRGYMESMHQWHVTVYSHIASFHFMNLSIFKYINKMIVEISVCFRTNVCPMRMIV